MMEDIGVGDGERGESKVIRGSRERGREGERTTAQ